MSERLKSLREKRMRAVEAMRAISDAAEARKSDLTKEEIVEHRKLYDEQDGLKQQIEAEERTLELARIEAEAIGKRQVPAPSDTKQAGLRATPEYRTAFNRWMIGGNSGISAEEARALSAGIGSQGGFTVMPEQMAADFVKFVDDTMLIRGLATTMRVTTAASLGVMSLDADPADADWTTEVAVGNEDTAMAFGKRKMVPNPLGKLIKVSNDLLRASAAGGAGMDVETLVRSRLAYKFALAQEKGFLLGTGVNQPLGLFTASSDGIPIGRDISTGNTTTAITMDGLISARQGVKDQYRARGRWLFHRDGMTQILKLKDSQNRYLWQPSQQAGQPDLLLGSVVSSSEYVPNTFTTGKYVGMFGDFSFYWIVDAMDLQLQRLVELFAATNQTGFIGRMFTDGQPVLGEAFSRITLA
jgi:HK97 family phage major capsid protein